MRKSKIAALLLALLMLMSAALSVSALTPPRPPKKFDDVPEDAWYAPHVDTVSWGLMKGTSENTFSPDMTLSRAMCVTILYRMACEPDVSDIIDNSDGLRFTDVKGNEWYTSAVVWAADKGIVNGRDGNIFDPNADITRAELATILYRYVLKLKLNIPQAAVEPYFEDADSIPDYADFVVKTMSRAGIIKGKDGNRFDPDSTATRAEAAALFARLSKTATEQNTVFLDEIGARISVQVDISGGFASPTTGELWFDVVFRPTGNNRDELNMNLDELKKLDIAVDATLCSETAIVELDLKKTESIDAILFGHAEMYPNYVNSGEYVCVIVTVTCNGESETYTLFDYVTVVW